MKIKKSVLDKIIKEEVARLNQLTLLKEEQDSIQTQLDELNMDQIKQFGKDALNKLKGFAGLSVDYLKNLIGNTIDLDKMKNSGDDIMNKAKATLTNPSSFIDTIKNPEKVKEMLSSVGVNINSENPQIAEGLGTPKHFAQYVGILIVLLLIYVGGGSYIKDSFLTALNGIDPNISGFTIWASGAGLVKTALTFFTLFISTIVGSTALTAIKDKN